MRTAANSVLGELRMLWHLTCRPVRGTRHVDRLESFYRGQAERYDGFRERLLQGRSELVASIDPPPAAVWIDLGAGTGANAEFLALPAGSVAQTVPGRPLPFIAGGRPDPHQVPGVGGSGSDL